MGVTAYLDTPCPRLECNLGEELSAIELRIKTDWVGILLSFRSFPLFPIWWTFFGVSSGRYTVYENECGL